MHDFIRFGYIGLDDHQLRVMKSLFALSAELSKICILMETSKLSEADVVLVNVDEPGAVREWNRLHRSNRRITPITLSAQGKEIEGVISLVSPIRLYKLIDALNDVVNESHIAKSKTTGFEAGSDLQILIVDDSYPVRRYMEQKLTELTDFPIQVGFAASGEEAIDKFQSKAYDLVFLDVMMSGVDGYKTCKAIKSHYRAYVVMLTSKKSPFDKVRGTMSGCDAFITKPPVDQRLVEEISKCFRQKSRSSNDIGETRNMVAC